MSIKTYADTVASAAALGTAADTGTGTVNISTQSLTISGGTGLDSTASDQTVTLAIDSTVATLTGSQTLTNKTLTSPTVNGATLTGTLNGSGILTLGAGSDAAPTYSTTGDINTGLFFPAADVLGFSTGGTERVRIDSTGNVGVGTTNPTGRLHLYESSASSVRMRVENSEGFGEIVSDGGALQVFSDQIRLKSGNALTEYMRINSSGDVGVGTSSPDAKVDIVSNSLDGLRQEHTDGVNAAFRQVSTGGEIKWQNSSGEATIFTADTERLRIDSSGNVGIGTSSPSGTLQIGDGSIAAPGTGSDDLVIANSGSGG